MQRPSVVIDLGFPGGVEQSSEVDAGRPGSPGRTGRRRLAAAVAVVLATLGLAAGDVVPPRLVQVAVVRSGTGYFELTGDGLYALFGEPPALVIRYGLGGHDRWSYGPAAGSLSILAAPGTALAGPQICLRPGDYHTTALAATTGNARWRRPGEATALVPGDAVLLRRPVDEASCNRMRSGDGLNADTAAVVWDVRSITTGDIRWSLPVPAGTRGAAVYEPGTLTARWLVTTTADGTTTLYDAATGARLVGGRLSELAFDPRLPRIQAPDEATTFDLVGEQLVTVHVTPRYAYVDGQVTFDGQIEVSAYDATTLAPRWHSRLLFDSRGPRYPVEPYQPVGCGALLCLSGPTGWIALDPASGAPRLRVARPAVSWYGRYALVSVADQHAGSTHYELVEAASGVTRLSLTGRDLRGSMDGQARLLFSFSAGDRTWFEALDLRTLRMTLLGSAPGRYGYCATHSPYIACATGSGVVRMWRMTPPGGG